MILDKLDADKVVLVPTRYGRMLCLSNDRYMGDAFLRTGEYSESEVALWRQLLPPETVACDIGANIGAHTVPLAKLCRYVFAFEPIPFLYRLLGGNVAVNGLANVTTLHAAVGRQRGQIIAPAFDFTQDNNYGGVALGGWQDGNPVPQVALDEVVPAAHFLKVDVEGMEADVFHGAERLIARCRPVLYFEANPEDGHPPTEGPKQLALIRQVQGYGYTCWWHFAPHYNPHNIRGAAPRDDHEATVVSFNVLALPSEQPSRIDGLEPIPLLAAPATQGHFPDNPPTP